MNIWNECWNHMLSKRIYMIYILYIFPFPAKKCILKDAHTFPCFFCSSSPFKMNINYVGIYIKNSVIFVFRMISLYWEKDSYILFKNGRYFTVQGNSNAVSKIFKIFICLEEVYENWNICITESAGRSNYEIFCDKTHSLRSCIFLVQVLSFQNLDSVVFVLKLGFNGIWMQETMFENVGFMEKHCRFRYRRY